MSCPFVPLGGGWFLVGMSDDDDDDDEIEGTTGCVHLLLSPFKMGVNQFQTKHF